MGTDFRSLKFAVVTKSSTVRYRTSFSSSGVISLEVTQGPCTVVAFIECGTPPKKIQERKETDPRVGPPALDDFLSIAL